MHKLIRSFSIVVLVMLLAGCVGPKTVGVSDHSWNEMSDSKRDTIRKQYTAVHKWQRAWSQQKESGPAIQVTLAGGQVKMPPERREYAFRPVHVTILPGTCQRVKVKAIDMRHKTQVSLCYMNKVLSLDASNYEWNKRAGTLMIHRNPLWASAHGLIYHNKELTTDGYASFSDLSIRIIEKSS